MAASARLLFTHHVKKKALVFVAFTIAAHVQFLNCAPRCAKAYTFALALLILCCYHNSKGDVTRLKKILSGLRKAIEHYNMIDEGDRIAVGVSMGKDSLSLLYALNELKKFYPKRFEIEAVTIGMDDTMDMTNMQEFCKRMEINFTFHKTNIFEIVFDLRKEQNPCSLCANMRRGALNNTAVALGCNKVALAHHKDDVIETVMLSLFFEGRFKCFSPVTYLDRKNIKVIRPMIYIPEGDIKGFASRKCLPVIKNNCPANGNTKRQYVKNLISNFNKENRSFKNNLFGALERSGLYGWND